MLVDMDNSLHGDLTSQSEDAMLEAIFSDGGSDSPIGGSDVIYDCKNPHWSLSRDGLKKILQIVLSFPSKATIFTTVYKDGDTIRFRADNRDVFLDASLPLLNTSPYLTGKVYLLDSVKFLAFLNSYTQFALSFDEDGTIYYESPYVRYKLDTVSAQPSVFPALPSSSTEWVKFPLSNRELGVFKNLYSFAVKLSDSRILVTKDKVEAFYTLYKFTVLNGSNVKENVVIRRLDLPTLKEVVGDNSEFVFLKDRLLFKFDLGYVSFLRVPYDEEAFMYPETFLTGDLLGDFELDVPLVKRALKLSTLFNVHELVFSPEANTKDIYMVVSDKARFKVGACLSSVHPLFIPVGMEIFANLLSTVSGSSLHVSVSDHGVQFADDTNVYSMIRSSMSHIKQGNLPPVLSTPVKSSQGIGHVDFQDSEVL